MKRIDFNIYTITLVIIKIIGFLIFLVGWFLLVGLTIGIITENGRIRGGLLVAILWGISAVIYHKTRSVFEHLINRLVVKQSEKSNLKHKLLHLELFKEKDLNDNFDMERTRLAKLCKMGDITAMYDMALLCLRNCSDKEKILIENYESNTCEETLNELKKFMNHHQGSRMCEFYMMWIIRAAVYGNLKAKKILDRCLYYKDKAYIPYEYYVECKTSKSYWSSESFYKAGLCDIIRGKEDCGLIFHKDEGYFEFYFVSYYEPPDDDGFGSEVEYTSVFYDEFFNRLPVGYDASRKEIEFGLKKIEEEREIFWREHSKQHKRRRRNNVKTCHFFWHRSADEGSGFEKTL